MNWASDKYEESAAAANKWMNEHAPEFVVEAIEEMSRYINYLQETIDDRDKFVDTICKHLGVDPQSIYKDAVQSQAAPLQNSGGTTMSTMHICDPVEAEKSGFCIEGPVCFIWEFCETAVCLGFNTLDAIWQADIMVDEKGLAMQYLNKDLHKAMETCNKLALMSNMAVDGDITVQDVARLLGFEG